MGEEATDEGSPVSKSKASVLSEVHPIFVLERAFNQVTSIGSSTAVLAIQNNNKLTVCNLGDSGFQVYRRAPDSHSFYLHQRSKEQTHSFNTPFQLTRLPTDDDCQHLQSKGKVQESVKLREVLRKHRESRMVQDSPDDADETTIALEVGDVIITATDGVFDNLFNHELLEILNRS